MKKVVKVAVEVSRVSLALAMTPARGAWHGARHNVLPDGWVQMSSLGGARTYAVDSGWLCATTRQLGTLPAAVDAKWKLIKAGKSSGGRADEGYFTLVLGERDSGASYVPGEVQRGALSITAMLSHFFLLSEWARSLTGSLVSLRFADGRLYLDGGGSELVLDGWRHAEQVGEAVPDVQVKLSARVVASVDSSGAVVRTAVKSSVILTGPYDVAAVAARLGEMAKNYGTVNLDARGVLAFEQLSGAPLTAVQWTELIRGFPGHVKGGNFEGCMLVAPVAVVHSQEVVEVVEVAAVVVAAVVPVVDVVSPGEAARLAAVTELAAVEQRAAAEAAQPAPELNEYQLDSIARHAAVRAEFAAHQAAAAVVVAQPAPVVLALPSLHGEHVSAYLARLICPLKLDFVRALLVELGGGVAASPVGLSADLAADVRRRVASLVRKDGRGGVACAAD